MPDAAIWLLLSRNYYDRLAVATQSAGDRSCFCNDLGIRIYRDVVVELDPKNPFAIWTWSYELLRNGKVDDASEAVHELNTEHAGSVLAQLGAALFHGVCGEPEAARKTVTDELRAAARNSELLSRELTHCLALAGETEEALSWLENTVRIGNINYPFWSQHNEWLACLRDDARFGALMIEVKQDWMSISSNSEYR